MKRSQIRAMKAKVKGLPYTVISFDRINGKQSKLKLVNHVFAESKSQAIERTLKHNPELKSNDILSVNQGGFKLVNKRG